MRLLNCRTLELEDDFEELPPYAILSHRWLDTVHEPTFQDVTNKVAKQKAGFNKILLASEEALRHDILYLWADTICIDKTNHVEFTESINSMYRYYAQSKVCFAYLADVTSKRGISGSDWFSRGWTLQELLAPSRLEFYSQSWECLGTKSDEKMYPKLAEATRITSPEVFRSFQPDDWTVAEKMSWASRRTTKRKEDMAYCLLGIFQVTMPLLYGEGDNAFMRLQQEIMRTSDDHSLFAWTDTDILSGSFCGLLARSPAQFDRFSVKCNNCIQRPSNASWNEKSPKPWAMTNLGVQIDLPLVPLANDLPSMFYALLGGGPVHKRPAIIVIQLHDNHFARIRPHLFIVPHDPLLQAAHHEDGYTIVQLVVQQRAPILFDTIRDPGIVFEHSQLINVGFSASYTMPFGSAGTWDATGKIVRLPLWARATFTADFRHEEYDIDVRLQVEGRGTIVLTSPRSINAPLMFPQRVRHAHETTDCLLVLSKESANIVIVITACITTERESSQRGGPLYSVLLQASRQKFMLSVPEQKIVRAVGHVAGICATTSYLVAAHEQLWKPLFWKYPQVGFVLFTLVPWTEHLLQQLDKKKFKFYFPLKRHIDEYFEREYGDKAGFVDEDLLYGHSFTQP